MPPEEAQLARQPIFDRELRIVGFELLFRQSPFENYFDFHDPDEAVERLIHDSVHVFGLHRLAPGRRAYINVTEKALLHGLVRRLPKDRVVIEVLETVRPTREVIEACRELKKLGYPIALDDFVYREGLHELLDLADVIKVDFLSEVGDPRALPRDLEGRGLIFLAEKVETLGVFERALRWGYTLFQGNYFQPAEILVRHAPGSP